MSPVVRSVRGWAWGAGAALSLASLAACGASGFGDRAAGSASTTAGDSGGFTSTTTQAGAGGSASGGGGGGPMPEAGAHAADPTRPYAGLCGDAKTCTPGSNQCLNPGLDAGPSADACSLVPAKGQVVGSCAVNGPGAAGQPCTTVADCAAGLGCVVATSAKGPDASGVCRPYCCGDVESCPDKTYCAPRPMADDMLNTPRLQVPVCVPTTNCQLLDDGSCPDGQTCSIVRASGTTSCVDPGQGQLGQACPCAAGLVCAKLTNLCKKLCHIGQDEVDCPNGGTCQGGSMGYPDGIGICVGGSMDQY